MRSRLLCCMLLFGAGSFGSPLWAGTCTISAPGLSFSNYDPTSSADVTGTGSATVNCSDTGVDVLFGFSVSISLSQGSSGTFTTRTLKQGAKSLGYNLYLNAGATGTVFGDGTAGTGTYAICYPGLLAPCSGNTGQSGQAYSVPVYGRITAGQDVSAGNYSDALIATVTF